MQGLTVLNFEGNAIRTIQIDGEMWWVLKDVCDVLNLSNPSMIADRLEPDERAKYYLGRQGDTNIINECGIYNVMVLSRKPEAKAFRRWLNHEVLPSIRKTGGYVANDDLFIDTYLSQADEGTKALFRQTLSAMQSLNRKIEADRPKVQLADAVTASVTTISVSEMAKLLRQNGFEFGEKRFYSWLRNRGYVIATGGGWNLPTQRSMEMGLFRIHEGHYLDGSGNEQITRTTRVTGKGQEYFIRKFKRGEIQ